MKHPERDPRNGGAPVIVTATVLLLLAGSAGVFVWALASREAPEAREPGDDRRDEPDPPPGTWEHILWRKKADLAQYRQTMALKASGDARRFQEAVEETIERFGETFRLADELLDPIRAEDGSIPPDYLGYVADLAPLKLRMSDLAREVSFETAARAAPSETPPPRD